EVENLSNSNSNIPISSSPQSETTSEPIPIRNNNNTNNGEEPPTSGSLKSKDKSWWPFRKKRGASSKRKKKENFDEDVEISMPFDVKHNIHVDFNSETGLSGLPEEWEAQIKGSGIDKIT